MPKFQETSLKKLWAKGKKHNLFRTQIDASNLKNCSERNLKIIKNPLNLTEVDFLFADMCKC